jgi:type IV secretory pathway TraG/TraD family ATPase VirD4
MPMIDSRSLGVTSGQSQRSLQTADELRTMKKGTILFVNASSPSAILRTIAYFEERSLRKLADQPLLPSLALPLELPVSMREENQEETTIVMEPLSLLQREEQELPVIDAGTEVTRDTDIAPNE